MTKDEVKKLRMNSPESLQFLNNATKFYNLMMMYRCAIREIQTKLEVLDDEFSVENNRNPISFIKTRIKKPNSIYNKLQKMGYEFTTENIQTYLNDVAGVRIVCAFIDDIYMISDLITQQDDIVADGLFCREIDGLFCRSSPDIIVRRRCVLSHKRRGWLQPSPSFRYSRNLALQDELYHPVINNGPAVLVCVDKRLGTGPVNQSRDAG